MVLKTNKNLQKQPLILLFKTNLFKIMKKILIFYVFLSTTSGFTQNKGDALLDTIIEIKKVKGGNTQFKSRGNIWSESMKVLKRSKALNRKFHPFRDTANTSNLRMNKSRRHEKNHDGLIRSETLKPVYITNEKKAHTFGYGFYKRTGFFGRFFGPHPISSISINFNRNGKLLQAVYIKDTLPDKNLRINELMLRIKSVNPDTLAKIKLYILPIDTLERKIGMNPLSDKIYIVSAKSGLKRFDVSSMNLYMPPGGILIGAFILEGDLETKLMPLKHKKSNSYRLKLVDHKTVLIGKIIESIASDEIYNLMYGISVEVLGGK